MTMNGKKAIMIGDNRPWLIGQVLLQIKETNEDVFDEVIIVDFDISDKDKKIMSSIMNCRFIEPSYEMGKELLEIPSFKKFSPAMFSRYEMFNLIEDYELIMWMDTDVILQGSLSELIESTKGYDLSMLREDPVNKSYYDVDHMRTNFTTDVEGYNMNAYLYCSGIIIIRNTLKQPCSFADWCYNKTIEWAQILNLPDQGVLNALIQEFSINVKPIGNHGKYGAYPYVGRDCSGCVIVHSWGPNKFWSNYYLWKKFPHWMEVYEKWVGMGGSPNPVGIRDHPKVSVIIPSYKPNINYFKESMETLLNQRCDAGQFSDFEVIIVSEPFEEESLRKYIESLNDPRIFLYFNDKRLGIAASLNRAIRLSKGDYIARMDDDDLADPYRLSKQSKYLDDHRTVTLCTSDYMYFGDMNEGRKIFGGEMSRTWSLLTCPFDHPTIMFRRSFFVDNELYYDESRGYVEDWELWQRAFHKGMIVGSINEVLFYHRWHNGSASQTDHTVIAMRQMIKANFSEIGLDIPDDDLYLFGPWNGKLSSEDQVQKLAEYFEKAKELNKQCKLYGEKELNKAFEIRLNEARTGDMDELKAVDHCKRSITASKVVKENKFKNKIKGWAGRVIKFTCWPFIKYHFKPIWETNGKCVDINRKVDEIQNTIQNQTSSIGSNIQNSSVLIEENNQILRETLYFVHAISNNVQTISNNNDRYRDEYHRHIDYLYRDIMITLRGLSDHWKEEADLYTDYPIAFDSNDTMYPHGTVRDNTRCPRFIKKCEKLLKRDSDIRFLDLGCSGGGIVLDALLRGHYGLGLEGCDISLKQQRAEWRLIPEHLKTCDITKPFKITHHLSDEIMKFDVITAWEVMEHIPEERLDQLFENVYNHLEQDGMFVTSIANFPDVDPVSGANWHVTLHEKTWWEEKFKSFGFEICEEPFDVEDYARGYYNPPNCYELLPSENYGDNEYNFHIVVKKKR